MPVKTWFYYLHHSGSVIAKANTTWLDKTIQEMGFRPCTKNDYLKVQKMLRSREKKALKIDITSEQEVKRE
jgi:hypothetical protein